MKKKLFPLLLVLILTVAFSACDNLSTQSEPEVTALVTPEPVRVYKIGILLFSETESMNAARESFLARLDEYGLSESEFSVDYKCAAGSYDEAKTIALGFSESGCDMVVAFSSPAARAAQEALKDSDSILLYAAVNNPGAELISAENDPSMTGISSKINTQAVMELISSSEPKPASIGAVYNADEQSSVSAAAEVKKYCEENSLTYVDGIVTDSTALTQTVKTTAMESDVLFIPDDSLTGSKFSEIIQAANEEHTPVYSTSSFAVKNGSAASVGVDSSEVGRKAADMAVQLIKGRGIDELEAFSVSGYDTYINQTALASLGITLPTDTLKAAVAYN